MGNIDDLSIEAYLDRYVSQLVYAYIYMFFTRTSSAEAEQPGANVVHCKKKTNYENHTQVKEECIMMHARVDFTTAKQEQTYFCNNVLLYDPKF